MAESSSPPNHSGLPRDLVRQITPQQLATFQQSQQRVDKTPQTSVTKGIGPDQKPAPEPPEG